MFLLKLSINLTLPITTGINMSEYERGKYYGKKKFHSQRSEASSSFGSRFFNSKNVYKPEKDFPREGERGEAKPKSIKQPTILLKAPDRTEERSASPKQTVKENEPATPITIVTNATHEHSSAPVIKQMTKSAKLLDDGIIYPENIQDYLQENNDFLVIGVIGGQGVGKSTVLNLLAHNNINEKLKKEIFKQHEPVDIENMDNIKILTDNISNLKVNTDEKEKPSLIFKEQIPEEVEFNINTTFGIDLYITQNRMILLDCQPLLSSAVLDELMRSENKRSNVISEFLPLENSSEIQGLQLTAFLMSVCHVLILVQDWFLDSNIIRFLQTVEMLKPTISNPEDEFVDYFPHLVILHNKAQMEDFTPYRLKTIQHLYKTTLRKTKMHLESGMGLGTGRIINSLCPENCGNPINLFLMPEYDEKTENIYKGHPSLEVLIKKLRSNLLGATKYPLTHVQLTEKNWLVYSAKVWDHVKKSSFFVEYTKLMP